MGNMSTSQESDWCGPDGEAGSTLVRHPMTSNANGWLAAPSTLFGLAYGVEGQGWCSHGVGGPLLCWSWWWMTTDFDGRVFEASPVRARLEANEDGSSVASRFRSCAPSRPQLSNVGFLLCNAGQGTGWNPNRKAKAPRFSLAVVVGTAPAGIVPHRPSLPLNASCPINWQHSGHRRAGAELHLPLRYQLRLLSSIFALRTPSHAAHRPSRMILARRYHANSGSRCNRSSLRTSSFLFLPHFCTPVACSFLDT